MSRSCDLLGVKTVSGNKISHSNRKTRTKFLPNLKTISFASEILGVDLRFKIAASTLRTINKFGSIDNFLINYRHAKLTEFGRGVKAKLKRKVAVAA